MINNVDSKKRNTGLKYKLMRLKNWLIYEFFNFCLKSFVPAHKFQNLYIKQT
jgi:hypothetical protein